MKIEIKKNNLGVEIWFLFDDRNWLKIKITVYELKKMFTS